MKNAEDKRDVRYTKSQQYHPNNMSQVRILQDTAADEEEREENKEGLPESVKDLNLNREGFE